MRLGCNGKPMLARAHRRFRGRLHRAGGGVPCTERTFKRVLTVSFEKQSESNAMWAVVQSPALFHPPQRGRRRLLCAYHPRVYAPLQGALQRRHQGGGERQAARRAQSAGAFAVSRTFTMKEVEDSSCCGTRSAFWSPVPPPTAPAPWSLSARNCHQVTQTTALDSAALPCARSRPCTPAARGQSTGRSRAARAGCLQAGRYHQSAQGSGLRGGVRAVQLVRSRCGLENLRLCTEGEG